MALAVNAITDVNNGIPLCLYDRLCVWEYIEVGRQYYSMVWLVKNSEEIFKLYHKYECTLFSHESNIIVV